MPHARTERGPFVLPAAEQKCAGSPDRSVALSVTLGNAPRLCKRFGITRVGDLTRLDRTGIPVACAVVPTAPILSLFNGKGTTRDAALASAVMEAVERVVVADPHVETHRRLVRDACGYLDLEAYGLLRAALDGTTDCAWGTNVIDGSALPVPMQLVQCPRRSERVFSRTTSNGLASGNTPAEALYHALLELVERHVWSLAQVRCELVPRFYGRRCDAAMVDALAFPTGDVEIDALAASVARAGLELQVMVCVEGDLPVAAIATLVEPHSDPPMAHQGLGCSLSPRHAVVRAITECVQSRVVDIAATRDDLLRAGDPARSTGEHARRVSALPENRWFFGLPSRRSDLAAFEDRSSDDLVRDVRTVLGLLADAELGPVVAIELAPPDEPISVMRVVAPRLETASLDGRLRATARSLFNPFSLVRTAHATSHQPHGSLQQAI